MIIPLIIVIIIINTIINTAAFEGERIVAVDKAPELPESIRHLVMHVTG